MATRSRLPRILTNVRGVAATEFALIAPALIFLIMGVLEMSYRFRAAEEVTRYVHQIADLVSREPALTTAQLGEMRNASVFMMKPATISDQIDLDVSSIGFQGSEANPDMLWRRVAGTPVVFELEESDGMGLTNESVIRVGVRYVYHSVLTDLFGGDAVTVERSAYARPRVERLVALDGNTDDGGALTYFGGA
ncbi:MAG: pilus assembly protein [Burkholderiales bacterium]|nr:MAG: pilus assembly protein [Burkholderiales bacterium]